MTPPQTIPASPSTSAAAELPPPTLASLTRHLSLTSSTSIATRTGPTTTSRAPSSTPTPFSRPPSSSSTPPLDATARIAQSRRDSSLRYRAALQDIIHRHSDASLLQGPQEKGRIRAMREDEDDIIDLSTMDLVEDRGVLRNVKRGTYGIGVFMNGKAGAGDDDDAWTNTSDEEGEGHASTGEDTDDSDELGGWADERSLQLPSVSFIEARKKLDDDHLDLREFLQEDARQRGIDLGGVDATRGGNQVLQRDVVARSGTEDGEEADVEEGGEDEDEISIRAVPSPSLSSPFRRLSMGPSSPQKSSPLRHTSLAPQHLSRSFSSIPSFAPFPSRHLPYLPATSPKLPSPLHRSQSALPPPARSSGQRSASALPSSFTYASTKRPNGGKRPMIVPVLERIPVASTSKAILPPPPAPKSIWTAKIVPVFPPSSTSNADSPKLISRPAQPTRSQSLSLPTKSIRRIPEIIPTTFARPSPKAALSRSDSILPVSTSSSTSHIILARKSFPPRSQSLAPAPNRRSSTPAPLKFAPMPGPRSSSLAPRSTFSNGLPGVEEDDSEDELSIQSGSSPTSFSTKMPTGRSQSLSPPKPNPKTQRTTPVSIASYPNFTARHSIPTRSSSLAPPGSSSPLKFTPFRRPREKSLVPSPSTSQKRNTLLQSSLRSMGLPGIEEDGSEDEMSIQSISPVAVVTTASGSTNHSPSAESIITSSSTIIIPSSTSPPSSTRLRSQSISPKSPASVPSTTPAPQPCRSAQSTSSPARTSTSLPVLVIDSDDSDEENAVSPSRLIRSDLKGMEKEKEVEMNWEKEEPAALPSPPPSKASETSGRRRYTFFVDIALRRTATTSASSMVEREAKEDAQEQVPQPPSSPSRKRKRLLASDTTTEEEELMAEEPSGLATPPNSKSSPSKTSPLVARKASPTKQRKPPMSSGQASPEKRARTLPSPPRSTTFVSSSPSSSMRKTKTPSSAELMEVEEGTDSEDPMLFTPTKKVASSPSKSGGSTGTKKIKRRVTAVRGMEGSEDEFGRW